MSKCILCVFVYIVIVFELINYINNYCDIIIFYENYNKSDKLMYASYFLNSYNKICKKMLITMDEIIIEHNNGEV